MGAIRHIWTPDGPPTEGPPLDRLALLWRASEPTGMADPASPPSVVARSGGFALANDAVFSISRAPLGIPDSTSELTIVLQISNGAIVSPGSSATMAAFSAYKDNTGVHVQNYTGGAQFYFYVYYAPSYNGAISVASIPFSADADQCIVATYRRGGYARVYVNGRLAGETAAADRDANVIGTSNYQTLIIGDTLSKTPYIRTVGVYLRELSAGEALSFSGDPDAWLRGSRTVWVPASTGGASYTFSASGSVVLSGASPMVRGKVFLPSGVITFSGTSPFTFTGPTSYTFSASGGAVFSGAAVMLRGYTFLPSGVVTFSGTSPFSSGSATSYTFSASGSVVFSGASLLSRGREFSPSGSVAFSGDAIWQKGWVFPTSGQVTFSGSAGMYFTSGLGSNTVDRLLKGYGV